MCFRTFREPFRQHLPKLGHQLSLLGQNPLDDQSFKSNSPTLAITFLEDSSTIIILITSHPVIDPPPASPSFQSVQSGAEGFMSREGSKILHPIEVRFDSRLKAETLHLT